MPKPPKQKQYTYPDVPFPLFETNRSGVILGSSGNGKSSMLISLLLGPYRGKHSRVWVCSPSARPGIDSLWDLWRSYVQEQTDWGDEESIFYDLSPACQSVASVLEMKERIVKSYDLLSIFFSQIICKLYPIRECSCA